MCKDLSRDLLNEHVALKDVTRVAIFPLLTRFR